MLSVLNSFYDAKFAWLKLTDEALPSELHVILRFHIESLKMDFSMFYDIFVKRCMLPGSGGISPCDYYYIYFSI